MITVISVSPGGDLVLSDGTSWRVAPAHILTAQAWISHQVRVDKQTTSNLSTHPFLLINQRSLARLPVVKPPKSGSF